MYTTSHNVCNGDTGNTDFIHCMHEFFKFALTCDNNYFCQFVYAFFWKFRNCVNNFSRSYICGNVCRGCFLCNAHRSRNGHGVMHNKSVISTCKTMFFGIQTFDFFFSGYTKADGMFDRLENNCHSNSNPCDCDEHTDELYAESMETAANQKTFPACASSVREKTNCKRTESTV